MTLTNIASASVILGIVSLIIVATDVMIHPQKMWIMNIVYPVTALYSGPIGLFFYYKIARNKSVKRMINMDMPEHDHKTMHDDKNESQHSKQISWKSVVKGTLHCGSGCTLGDIIAETLLLYSAINIVKNKLINGWIIDYILAFVIGIIFQYSAIKPMKHLSARKALTAALKADAFSLTSWQVGMYGGMAIADFLIFRNRLQANSPIFWFVMQAAMLLGFVTAYPVNWWLIKKGVKEAM
jgi:hypothetical protein